MKTREVIMYRISFLSLILLALGACATPAPRPSSTALLDFADLAAEITVQHEALESTPIDHGDIDKNSVD